MNAGQGTSLSRCATPVPGRWSGLAFVMLFAMFSEAHGAASKQSLDYWLGQDLFAWIDTTLAEHQRVRGQRLMVAALAGSGAPVTPDALTGELVTKISDRIAATPGLRLVAGRTAGAEIENPSRDCDRWGGADLVVGVHAEQTGTNRHRVTLRVLERADNEWIGGLTRQWTGKLSRAQRRASARPWRHHVPTGTADDPVPAGDATLTTRLLARGIGCEILGGHERPVLAGTEDPSADGTNSIRNALIESGAVTIADGGTASIRIDAEHDDDMHRLIATLEDATRGVLHTTSIHVVGLPARGGPTARIVAGDPAYHADTTISLNESSECHPADFAPFNDCVGLRVETPSTHSVWLVASGHDGIFRIGEGRCLGHDRTIGNTSVWRVHPSQARTRGLTDWFAIAAPAASGLSQQISNLVDALPDACAGVSAGLRGTEADRWLDDVDAILEAGAGMADWQGRRIEPGRQFKGGGT